MTTTCRYCHVTLPRHVGLATHYAICAVLANCLAPASPFSSRLQISEAEKVSRANYQREMALARARLKAEKHI